CVIQSALECGTEWHSVEGDAPGNGHVSVGWRRAVIVAAATARSERQYDTVDREKAASASRQAQGHFARRPIQGVRDGCGRYHTAPAAENCRVLGSPIEAGSAPRRSQRVARAARAPDSPSSAAP